ncbi:MAG: hypothetical protein F4184_06220 [Gemmatimonadetes bacterium]|nr:hypothetical protein [Gemmatimonadota bacterium]
MGHENDESNLSFRVVGSWSAGTNRLYLMMERFDNYWDRNGIGAVAAGDDSWEIMIDADHGGDRHFALPDDYDDDDERQRNQGRFAQNAHYCWPDMPDANRAVGWKWFFNSKSTWHDVPPWGDYGFQLDGEVNSGEVTARIEVMTGAWDDFHWIGPDDSQIHTFTEGNTMGLGWVVHDMDSAEEDNGGASDGGWGINPNIQMWFDCVNCSDFLLAPIDPRVDFSSVETAVEEESWGRIKAAYIQ